ncbi:unsaturated chondroitin disaccharide hydrolase [Filimonas lacunae]|uniref:Unsaturated chondroitin disaccharide hydrolase n=1 Tax=Filimonas lacunae TaxID=477680 RepID=A0A173MHA6_9BACT|nr:glycoside hydrolase family 88 protein [Filimonas lacunae]BAV07004.1 alpha-1,2-mannosidase [Filimonas lacunae]SIS96550.1 unsaturated chondroitin disaccharide hydrolase [Filimonas lacunae]
MNIRITIGILLLTACHTAPTFTPQKALDYCTRQAAATAAQLPGYDSLPRSIATNGTRWKLVDYKDWTSGFWPGVLWYVYEYTKDTAWKNKADTYSRTLTPLAYNKAYDHDIGFQLYCSMGNGYRLTHDTSYRRILLAAADTLATLFNPKAGTILSWPRNVQQLGGHNTIIDNMINLELLFWAGKNGSPHCYDIAVQHATTTMHNHFRPDHTCYHVVVYDTLTGQVLRRQTHQGYADNSVWARGQSWAIYGYTLCYRETHQPQFLTFAQQVADAYLQRLGEELIPYWDFDDAAIPQAPRDASAAAVTASALLELSTQVTDKVKSKHYYDKAVAMLAELSTPRWQSSGYNTALLQHSTGHKPNGSEIDAAIIYADYYYIEGLLRLQKLQKGNPIF